MAKRNQQELFINLKSARSLALEKQGLTGLLSFGNGSEGALQTIRHLGYVQLDTLAVVARAHHHTLWTRTKGYSEDILGDLMREKKIFEYWSHAAACLPMEDFRFSLPRKEEFRKGRSHWFAKDKKIMQYVLDRIRAEGPLAVKHFETDRRHGSWFDWKPAKIALEQLFHDGTLMVSERKGFQKVYDLAERIIPARTDVTPPSAAEMARHLILSNLRAHGIASAKDITHLQRGKQKQIAKELDEMLKDGRVKKARVKDLSEEYFTLAETKFAESIPTHCRILSPFDNVLIRRERLLKIFKYNYAIECYLPEAKRTFGYFCLPVLYDGEFIARFDPKANRATKTFIVINFYLEKKPADFEKFLAAFAGELKSFSAFNGCEKIVIEKTVPAGLKMKLSKALS
ncbi:MAG TPA: crosslink repair DNA glycosylase YcaQ family protein [Bacteroidia bacterium]|nr:crosslink repair DNA glycosylase YcaQ family protein [Bacteroidia bacterium]